MTDRAYPRPAVNLDGLLDALHEAGADAGTVGIGNPDMIGISIDGATAEEIDAIWERAALVAALKEADKDGVVSSEAVDAWLASWGTENELPAPTIDGIRQRLAASVDRVRAGERAPGTGADAD